MLKRAFNVLPFMLFPALLFDIPAREPLLWFSILGAALVVYAGAGLFMRDQSFAPGSVFLAGLLLAGFIGFTGLRWLHSAYIPYTVFVSSLFGLWTVVITVITVPLLELQHYIFGPQPDEEMFIFALSAVMAGFTYFGFSRLRKAKAGLSSFLTSLSDASMDSLSGESLLHRDMSISLEATAEIKEILLTLRHAAPADAVTFFASKGGDELELRATTDEQGVTVSSVRGAIQWCLEKEEPVVAGRSTGKKGGAGYRRVGAGGLPLVAAVPVMSGNFVLGVLAADRDGGDLFTQEDIEVLEMFSGHVSRVLEKQRVYAEMERSHVGLRVLYEESSGLLSSLKPQDVIEKLMDGARRITSLNMVFFMKEGPQYRVVSQRGIELPRKRKFSLKDTVLDMTLKAGEQLYVPDLSGYKLPPLPFKTRGILSVFAQPLTYEDEVLGVMVAVSARTHSLVPLQMELLKVLANQASTSLQNAMLHARIEKMATTDGLTGLANHREFQERLTEEIVRTQRYERPLSFLLMDIDFFKKVNDTYGHPAGDMVLRSVAQIVAKTVRSVDLPARYGGEEFSAMLVDTDLKGALQTAERIRKAVRDSVFTFEGRKIRVTLSVGVACIPEMAKAKEELIDKADKALYRAKHDGRDRVVRWSAELSAQ